MKAATNQQISPPDGADRGDVTIRFCLATGTERVNYISLKTMPLKITPLKIAITADTVSRFCNRTATMTE
ncbi:hypothetical protein [Dickeya solani]|uniref:Uncharacterized protein n=2 Tax=Dickeya solani TaxID=1089444 RepID=A0AAP7E9D0_9GAMM|nr:hypothetical protein [Dickeya solani]AYQ48684.1 hypothetical protein CTB91_02895 [Dickeya solani]AYQ52847.1 hypothetical protein DSOL99_02892 [Dickeya solani]ERO56287.1 hypothetical protein A544_2833 [Dickeya solani D s0432-1]MBD3603481.1 hypothetical protein [Dickeya solani]MBJ2331909.1 hypothetical protein [Dickeya solani]